MKKALALLLVLTTVLWVLPGCGSASPSTTLNIPSDYTLLNTASGSSGGLWYTLMICYGELLKNQFGISLQSEPGGGGTINLLTVGKDDHTFGFTNNAAIYCGLNGIGYDHKILNVRTMFPLYPSIQLFYALDPNLKTIYDLKDKIVCLGPSGGGVVDMTKLEFETFGIKPRGVVNMAFADALTALKDGTIDCVVDAGGHPNASVTELETTQKVSLPIVPETDMQKIVEIAPYYSVFTISAANYKSISSDTRMLGFYSVAICTEAFPDDVVYAMTKAAYDNYKDIVQNVAAAKDIALENIKYMYGPMHPGAIRYYEELGIDVSEFYPEKWLQQ
jgi:TRAP transporter TAXI family solute receptor